MRWQNILKVKDLIKNKDYDCISYRLKMPDNKVRIYGESIFIGEAASKNGKLISLDGDIIYDEEDTVVEICNNDTVTDETILVE